MKLLMGIALAIGLLLTSPGIAAGKEVNLAPNELWQCKPQGYLTEIIETEDGMIRCGTFNGATSTVNQQGEIVETEPPVIEDGRFWNSSSDPVITFNGMRIEFKPGFFRSNVGMDPPGRLSVFAEDGALLWEREFEYNYISFGGVSSLGMICLHTPGPAFLYSMSGEELLVLSDFAFSGFAANGDLMGFGNSGLKRLSSDGSLLFEVPEVTSNPDYLREQPDGDWIVVCGAGYSGEPGQVLRISADGVVLWSNVLEGEPDWPLMLEGGSLCQPTYLHDPQGNDDSMLRLRWFSAEGESTGELDFAPGYGVVLVAAKQGGVYCYSPDGILMELGSSGEALWELELPRLSHVSIIPVSFGLLVAGQQPSRDGIGWEGVLIAFGW